MNGLGHLSLVTDDSTAEMYNLQPIYAENVTNPKPGILKIEFDREIARNQDGKLDFHSFAERSLLNGSTGKTPPMVQKSKVKK